MSEKFTIEYDPDWLTFQILVLVGIASGIGHGVASYSEMPVSLIVTALLTTVVFVVWLWKSVRPRVMEDVHASV